MLASEPLGAADLASPLMVQRQLGHADLRMTLGTYGHLFRIGMTRSPNIYRSCGNGRNPIHPRPVRGLMVPNSCRQLRCVALTHHRAWCTPGAPVRSSSKWSAAALAPPASR